MPGFQARRLCPELIFVRTRFDAYQAASRQIRAIFRSYTDLVEPLSLDEAYLDVTAPKRGPPSRDRDRARDQARDPRGDRAHRLGRGVVQQVPGQGRLGHGQARRPVRDPARGRPRVHREAADRALLRRRARSPRAR